MLTLEFAGWFCCRLSTDPDPSDELAQAALGKRLRELGRIEPRMLISYGFRVDALGGEGAVDGNADPGATLDTAQPWPFRAWLGAWDGDALCGFARGRLEIPTR